MSAALQLPLIRRGPWVRVRDGNDLGRSIFDRHYSRRRYRDGLNPKLYVGPGEKMVLVHETGRALFVWRKFIDASGQRGVNCAVFRNEGAGISSELIREADDCAWRRWPGERLYTYVRPDAVCSTNPGYCFLAAGWHHVGWTQGGLRILAILCKSGQSPAPEGE